MAYSAPSWSKAFSAPCPFNATPNLLRLLTHPPATPSLQIASMTALTSQYLQVSHGGDLDAFTRLLHAHGASPLCDEFVRSHLSDLLASTRAQKTLSLVEPYTRVALSYVASELGVGEAEAEAIVARLLIEGRLPADAAIDQPRRLLVLRGATPCAPSERSGAKGPAGAGAAGVGAGAGAAPAAGAAGASKQPAVRATEGRYAELAALANKLAALVTAVDSAAMSVISHATVGRVASGGGGGGGGGVLHGMGMGMMDHHRPGRGAGRYRDMLG